ncbi:MAG: threonine/serine exporter family protein [Erysipelotrichales bacterium]|nr:threonine/serine exporter family protein [Erysipelotrichales bacterium]
MDDLRILNSINHIGYLLLKHGAEIYRVEESLEYMCKSFGFTNIEVFAIPTFYTLSLTLHDGQPYQITKRSRVNRIHLDHLYELNCLVRNISAKKLSIEQIEKEIEDIENQTLNLPLIFIGYIISASMFCVFFGGGVNEMYVSGIIGMALYFFIYIMERVNINSIVRTLLASMLLASIAIFSNKLGFIYNLQSVITGSLMILVPGIAITNSLRDIISGDFISGLARMSEAILIATSIAIGVGIMIILLGGI